MTKKITLEEFIEQLADSSLQELEYIRGRYGSPSHYILREKIYEYEAAKRLPELVHKEIMLRATDDFLSDED